MKIYTTYPSDLIGDDERQSVRGLIGKLEVLLQTIPEAERESACLKVRGYDGIYEKVTTEREETPEEAVARMVAEARARQVARDGAEDRERRLYETLKAKYEPS